MQQRIIPTQAFGKKVFKMRTGGLNAGRAACGVERGQCGHGPQCERVGGQHSMLGSEREQEVGRELLGRCGAGREACHALV